MRVAWKWLRPDLVKCDRGVVSTESKLAGVIDNHCARFLSMKTVVMTGTVSRLAGGIGLHCENLHPLI